MGTDTLLQTTVNDSGLKQRFIAEVTGIHESSLSRIFSGKQIASPEERRLIAAALRRTVSELWPDEVTA